MSDVRDLAAEILEDEGHIREERFTALHRDLEECEERLTRLTDASLDGLLDKETFEARKTALFGQRRSLRDAIENPQEIEPFGKTVLKILGRGSTAYLNYDLALPEEKREIVKELTSDPGARGKTLEITMRNEYQAILEWRSDQNGAPRPGLPRIPASLPVSASQTDAVRPPSLRRKAAASRSPQTDRSVRNRLRTIRVRYKGTPELKLFDALCRELPEKLDRKVKSVIDACGQAAPPTERGLSESLFRPDVDFNGCAR